MDHKPYDLIEKAKKRALELFLEKRANCAESVFRAIHELTDTNLPVEVAALATPLGGGIGIRGENCGAMLGGVLALGLIYGRKDPYKGSLEEHRRSLWGTYALYNQLPRRFKDRFGTLNCWELTEDLTYGTKACREKCEAIIAETAGLTMGLIQEAETEGLHFQFEKNILTQAAEATGLTLEELVDRKTRGEPFPERKKGR